jgi:hypothetical protein
MFSNTTASTADLTLERNVCDLCAETQYLIVSHGSDSAQKVS